MDDQDKMTQPYVAPKAPAAGTTVDELRRRRKFWLRAVWISIVGVIVPPLLGFAGTVIGMVRAFGEVSNTGSSDPEALAGDISFALITTAGGLVVSVVAFLVFIGVLIRFCTLPKPPSTVETSPQPKNSLE